MHQHAGRRGVRYPWARFWLPREEPANLTTAGYFSEPESRSGAFLNPSAASIESFSDVPCLILLGEPGSGKSAVVEDFYPIDLLSYSEERSLREDVFADKKVANWIINDSVLQIVLDSLDEGTLGIPRIANVLLREIGKLKDHLGRLRLRIVCRAAEWKSSFEDGLRLLFGSENVRALHLAPLRRTDIVLAAELNGLDAPRFLELVERREAQPLAIRPITLNFLLAAFRKTGTLPPTKAELYGGGCLELCEESQRRKDVGWKSNFPPKTRLKVASRLAAYCRFGGYGEIWNGRTVDAPSNALPLLEVIGGEILEEGVAVPVDVHAVEAALDTGLFVAKGEHRLGWAHQTYLEFLAATFLMDEGLSKTQVLSLFTVSQDGAVRVAPQLAETAGWLVSADQSLFEQILESDPTVLLQADIQAISAGRRLKLVESLLRRHEANELLDGGWNQRRLFNKLEHPELANQLRPYLLDHSKAIHARRAAIEMAEACGQVALESELLQVALDPDDDISARVDATNALAEIGSDPIRSQLSPLALMPQPADVDDELKGCALRAYPNNRLERIISVQLHFGTAAWRTLL